MVDAVDYPNRNIGQRVLSLGRHGLQSWCWGWHSIAW
jgi:hypothetical protein